MAFANAYKLRLPLIQLLVLPRVVQAAVVVVVSPNIVYFAYFIHFLYIYAHSIQFCETCRRKKFAWRREKIFNFLFRLLLRRNVSIQM